MSKLNSNIYCKDLLSNKLRKLAETGGSPNNLRRIFISADGIVLDLFVSNASKPTFETIKFAQSDVIDCFISRDYVPMISALTDLVCSNLEEIIFCTKSYIGIELPQAEVQLQTLLKGYSGALSSDMRETLLKRFSRLRAIEFTNMSLHEVTGAWKELKKADTLVADCESFKQSTKITSLNNTEWSKAWKLRPQHYALDIKDGNLDKHLTKVREYVKGLESTPTESKSEKFTPKQQDLASLKSLLNICNSVYISTGVLSRLTKECINPLLSESSVNDFMVQLKHIHDNIYCEDTVKSIDSKVFDSSDMFEEFNNSLKKKATSGYSDFVRSVDAFISSVALNDTSLTLKLKLKLFTKKSIYAPESLSSTLVSKYWKYSTLTTRVDSSIKVSLQHIGVCVSKLLVSRSTGEVGKSVQSTFWATLFEQ